MSDNPNLVNQNIIIDQDVPLDELQIEVPLEEVMRLKLFGWHTIYGIKQEIQDWLIESDGFWLDDHKVKTYNPYVGGYMKDTDMSYSYIRMERFQFKSKQDKTMFIMRWM